MSLVSSFVVFVLVWWSVIFCILPLGLSTQYEEQGQEAAPGSPKALDIKKKFMLTTVISIIIWAIIYAFISADILDLSGILHH